MKIEKNCINCKHGKFIHGYMETREDLGWPDEIKCQCKDVPDEVLEKYDESNEEDFYSYLPNVCGYYDPRMVGKCINCQREINKPIIDTIGVIEFFSGELSSVCSKDCEIIYKNTINNIVTYNNIINNISKNINF